MKPRFTITETPTACGCIKPFGPQRKDRSWHYCENNRNKDRSVWRVANPGRTRYHGTPTEFVCVDGEGITLPSGEHRYVLLGVGNRQIQDPAGLPWNTVFDFLWSQFRTGSVAYTGFFLSYDFIQTLKTLPEDKARELLTTAGRKSREPREDSKRIPPFPVRYGDWEFDILGTKRLKIRKRGSSRWMNICDAGPFFQTSFLNVIDPERWSEPVVTPEEYDIIARGKSGRANAVLDSDMGVYNALENAILARVLGKLNEGFQQLGIHLSPGQWFGPGQCAQAWLDGRAITATRLQEVTPRAALDAARASYFGGWFEIMAHGILPGTTWEYDINSAYPFIISQLPCLEHGKWRHSDNAAYAGAGLYTLVRASVRSGNPHIGAMLHRDVSGNISRPIATEGWYWLHELQAAVRAGLVSDYTGTETWSYLPCDCPPPFREIPDLYRLRQETGKNTPLGIAIKLLLNSLYGKTAQSIGTPKYANPVYASLITAGTRTMILNAIATHPFKSSHVLMVATDGIYFSTPHPGLTISSELGDWEANQKQNLTLFKPGVYWDDKARDRIAEGKAPVFKARGVNARDFGAHLAGIDAVFRELASSQPNRITWPEVQFPVSFSMVTAVQALARGKWELAGTLVTDPVNKQSSDPKLKRSRWYWKDGILRSRPPLNDDPYEPSKPYDKKFGLEDPEYSPFGQLSQEAEGITPDGLPGNLWKEVLYG